MNNSNMFSYSGFFLLVILIINSSFVCASTNSSLTCGVILPLSGDYQNLGTEVMQGIQIATDQINAQGGADGYKIHLDIADDMSDPKQASSLFAGMKEKGIPVVIGSVTTPLTLPMAEQTKMNATTGTVLISPLANGNELYGISPAFYQVLPPVFYLGNVIADWLSYSADRSALVYTDDSYGRSFRDTIKDRIKNSTTSSKISSEIPLVHNNPGFSQTTSQILDNVSDTVVLIGFDTELLSLLKALNDAGFEGQVVLGESYLMDILNSDTSNKTGENFSLVTINAYTTLVPGSKSEQFVAAYQNLYHMSPDGTYAGYGYDSMMIIEEALIHERQTENITSSSLIQGLRKVQYYGITGPKIFDEHNAVSPAYDRFVYQNGSFKILSTSIR